MNLAATLHGSGPTLLFLHGLFGSGENLRGVGRAFETDYTVIYPDLPNHGDSPHTSSAGYGELAQAVADLIAERDVAPAIVAGHSMGGKVAMRLALDRPDLVRALVVLDMAPRPYEPSHTTTIDAMLSLPTEEVENRADADRRLAEAIPSAPVRSFLLKNLVKEGERYRWRLNLALIREQYDAILGWSGEGMYDGPALFVGGSRSKYLRPDRDDDLVHRYFPHATIHMIEGAGHWIHSERPREVHDLIAGFLGDLRGAGTDRNE